MTRRRRSTRSRWLWTLVSVLAALAAPSIPLVEAAQASDVGECKIGAPPGVFRSGFPVDPNHVPSAGRYDAAVLFVEFPDHPHTESTEESFGRAWQQEAEDFVEQQSNGSLDLAAVAHHEWLPMSQSAANYSLGSSGVGAGDFLAEAVALADPNFDFTGYEAVWLVYERTAQRSGGEAWFAGDSSRAVLAENGTVSFWNGVILGMSGLGAASPDFDPIDVYVAHEVLHTFGLPDLYDWERDRLVQPPEAWRFVGNFGPMGSIVGFMEGDPSSIANTRNANEMLAWQRWLLGWIDDERVVCASGQMPIEVSLTSLVTLEGSKAIVVPLGEGRAVVVEARFMQRYDLGTEKEGVLVYLVDTAVESGDGPLRVLNPISGEFPSARDLLGVGDSLETQLLKIEVVGSSVSGFDVRLVSNACDGKRVTIDMRDGESGIGTAGDDVIMGTSGADVIDAGAGNDTICAGAGDDIAAGGDGNDVMFGGDGIDVLRGNQGADRIEGGPGADRLLGGIGTDDIRGDAGGDYIGGFGGADIIHGGPGPDVIFGGFGADVINGGPGSDTINGLIGNDTIRGGGGADVLNGDRGNDTINGGGGNDTIAGGNANDVLFGDGGDDSVHGGRADDHLSGGTGTDTCIGNKQHLGDTTDLTCETIFGVP